MGPICLQELNHKTVGFGLKQDNNKIIISGLKSSLSFRMIKDIMQYQKQDSKPLGHCILKYRKKKKKKGMGTNLQRYKQKIS